MKKTLFDIGKEKVKKVLSAADFVHVTSDGWEHAVRHYQGIMAVGAKIEGTKAVPFEFLLALSSFPADTFFLGTGQMALCQLFFYRWQIYFAWLME